MRNLPAILSVTLAAALTAQQPRHDLRVAYVGEADSARAAAFQTFSRERFAVADTFARWQADPSELAGYDVVLLDWPQSDDARGRRAAGESPLGSRDEWRTPTVLLGSAGLNLACAWAVRGGSG